MRELYTCNIGYENKKIEEFLLDKIQNKEEVVYILPTIESIEKTKKYYIEKLGGFFNLTFHTFDSIKKTITRTKPVDEPFSLYIISNILKNNNYKYLKPLTDGLVEKTMNFIKRAKEEMIDVDLLYNCNSEFLKEIADVIIKYDAFLNEHNLIDAFSINLDLNKLNYKNVIVDGFFTFREVDFLILEKLCENSNIIVNIPFYFDKLDMLEDTKRKILSFDFNEIDLTKKQDIRNLIDENKDKIKFIIEENENLEARTIFQELKKENINNNISFEKMAIVSANKNKFILDNRDKENLELNINKVETINTSIIFEFKNILNFSIDKSRENILRRINSNYFKITNNPEEMEYEIIKMDFNNLDELIENTKEEVSLKDNNLKEFLELMEKLTKSPKDEGGFKYYSNYFENYLNNAQEYIKEIYGIFKNDDYLKRDMNIISSIKLILENLKTFDRFFEIVELETYINILKIYVDNISIENKNYYATSYISLIESIFIDYEVSFLSGLTESYPNYKEGNFIFSSENKRILKNLGMKSEDDLYIYENELIKIFSLIVNSKKIYMSSSSLESHSVLLDLFFEEEDKNISKNVSTNFSDLFFEILKDKKISNTYNKEKIANLKYIREIKNLNERIYPEQNRNNNKFDGVLSGCALVELRKILKDRNYSATDFDLYKESPFRFLFERLLGIEEMQRFYDDKYYLKIGSFYHKILEEYFRECPKEYNEQRLIELTFNNFFERKVYGDELNTLETLEFDYHLNLLQEFIKNDIKNRKNNNISGLEVPFKYALENINIVGRIDRIDEFEDYEILIDYKSGTSPSKNKILDGESFQFPIYALSRDKLVVEAKYGKIKDAKYTTVLKNKEVLGGNGKKDFTNKEYFEFLELTKKRILDMYLDIYNGKFPYIKSKYNNITELCRGEGNE